MNKKSSEIIQKYMLEINTTIGKLPVEEIAQVIEFLEEARLNGNRVFLFGNGGSAATASHFASDLSKGTICKGKPRIKAFALTDNVALISAWANDAAYDDIFAEQLENLVEPEDVVIGISGSGNSSNVLNGIELARAKGSKTIGFTGFDGGKLKFLVDIAVVVPNYDMKQVEDIHLLIEHIITTCIREGC